MFIYRRKKHFFNILTCCFYQETAIQFTLEIFIKSNLTVKLNNCNNTKIIDTEINQIKV